MLKPNTRNFKMNTIDARRLLCPLPVIRLQNMVNRLTEGDAVEILCTDPGTLHDIPAWTRIHGHQILETKQENNEILFVVRVC